MEKNSHRYTEKDLHNVATLEAGLQILSGAKKLRKADPRPMKIPVVQMEGREDLLLGETEWLTIAGAVIGVENELICEGKGCIVNTLKEKYA